MARIKVGFDIGGSSMKAAVVQGGGLRVETVRLPEKLIDENGITPGEYAGDEPGAADDEPAL